MTDPRRAREDQSGEFRYWDGEKWQERTAPPRPRHPDFPPPAKPAPPPKQHTNPSTKRLALVVASTLSVLGTAIGLSFCATSAAEGHADHALHGWLFEH